MAKYKKCPSLSGHLLRPVGIGPPCLPSGAVSIEEDKYPTTAHSLKSTRASHSAQYCRYQKYSDALKNSYFQNYSTVEGSFSFGGQIPDY